MRNHPLGRTGLFVSELCLGTMTFGGGDGIWSQIGDLQQADAERLGPGARAGINFIDTADVYAGGVSEQITGQALKNLKVPRENVIVATKVFGETGPGPNARGAIARHILDAVKASLKRLELDHIDLYQIHGSTRRRRSRRPCARSTTSCVKACALCRRVELGRVADRQGARRRGAARTSRFASLQAYYTVAGRDLERELIPMLQSEGVGLMVWSPLAGGLLSGKYGRGQQGEKGSRRTSFDFPPVNRERAYDGIDAMRPIAQAHGVSVAQVALAWLLHQPVVTSVIIGAKRAEQLADNLAATQWPQQQELAALDEVSRLPSEYPGWMFERQGEYRRKQLLEARR